jgi:hypothetical protein
VPFPKKLWYQRGMKFLTVIVAFLSIVLTAGDAHAALEKLSGKFTGIVLQSGTVNGIATTISTPITKRWLLNIFGHSEIKTDDAFYFYDTSGDAYVLASKNGETVYGTILQYPSSSNVDWQDDKHHQGVFCDTLTMFNAMLSGTEFDFDKTAVSGGKFIVSGNIGSTQTIVIGNFHVTYPVKK